MRQPRGKKLHLLLAGLAALVLSGSALWLAPGPTMTHAQTLEKDGVRAPEFPEGFTWLNTDKPLSIRGLRGKVVLLDFWTYGCINCMHILPDLKRLEQKYPRELVVISVHSAKFETEADAKNIRNALLRYNIEHPVLVDQKMKVWTDYTVRAWPTFVLIDPAGRVVGTTAGEGQYEVLDRTIAATVKQFRGNGLLNETPLQLTLEKASVSPRPLSYPGKVLEQGDRIFIADSNHNRIVVTNSKGQVADVIGNGFAALKDGSYASASFANPQGLALDGDTLFVADTNNHALRSINLKTRQVTTLTGDGKQAPWRSTGGAAPAARLSSPWDVVSDGYSLYLAMAGSHQIWRYDRQSRRVEVFAGDGSEARRDGDLYFSAFAQPSALALAVKDGKKNLLVADSEISCIRRIEIQDAGKRLGRVSTVAGGDLFDFGDQDGRGDDVRLQHPLGVVVDRENADLAYIADTYNGKIKTLNWTTGEVNTLAEGSLDEPGGLALGHSGLIIADTNNHRIQRLDLHSLQFSPLTLSGLKPGHSSPLATAEAGQASRPKSGALQTMAPRQAGKLVLDIRLPEGFELNRAAPQQVSLALKGTGLTLLQTKLNGKAVSLPLQVGFQSAAAGSGTLLVTALLNYCSKGDGAVCKAERIEQKIAYTIGKNGGTTLRGATVQLP